jgi:hypothetical protein
MYGKGVLKQGIIKRIGNGEGTKDWEISMSEIPASTTYETPRKPPYSL